MDAATLYARRCAIIELFGVTVAGTPRVEDRIPMTRVLLTWQRWAVQDYIARPDLSIDWTGPLDQAVANSTEAWDKVWDAAAQLTNLDVEAMR